MRKVHDRLIKTSEVAEILGCTPATVRNMTKDKKLPYVNVGRTIRFHYKTVVKYLKKNSVLLDDPCEFCSPDKPHLLLAQCVEGTMVSVFLEGEFLSLAKDYDKEEFDDYLDSNDMQISYCPNCGRKL